MPSQHFHHKLHTHALRVIMMHSQPCSSAPVSSADSWWTFISFSFIADAKQINPQTETQKQTPLSNLITVISRFDYNCCCIPISPSVLLAPGLFGRVLLFKNAAVPTCWLQPESRNIQKSLLYIQENGSRRIFPSKTETDTFLML